MLPFSMRIGMRPWWTGSRLRTEVTVVHRPQALTPALPLLHHSTSWMLCYLGRFCQLLYELYPEWGSRLQFVTELAATETPEWDRLSWAWRAALLYDQPFSRPAQAGPLLALSILVRRARIARKKTASFTTVRPNLPIGFLTKDLLLF